MFFLFFTYDKRKTKNAFVQHTLPHELSEHLKILHFSLCSLSDGWGAGVVQAQTLTPSHWCHRTLLLGLHSTTFQLWCSVMWTWSSHTHRSTRRLQLKCGTKMSPWFKYISMTFQHLIVGVFGWKQPFPVEFRGSTARAEQVKQTVSVVVMEENFRTIAGRGNSTLSKPNFTKCGLDGDVCGPTASSILTYAVGQNDGQHHGHAHRHQGRALPRTMFGRLLELEGPPGQAVSGQRPRGCGVHCSCCHGVTGGCRAKERCRPSARLKEKMPGREDKTDKRVMKSFWGSHSLTAWAPDPPCKPLYVFRLINHTRLTLQEQSLIFSTVPTQEKVNQKASYKNNHLTAALS